MDLSALGQRIRDERVRRGISVRGLAREVGVSASMISQIETAKSRPSVSTLYAITSALGMSIEDVFRDGPLVAGPEVAGPEVAGPGVAGPGVAGPGVAGPGVASDPLPPAYAALATLAGAQRLGPL